MLRLARFLACALIASFSVTAVAAAADEEGSTVTKTRVCVVKKTKRARVVRVTERCRNNETRMTWKRYQQIATNSAASGDGSTVVGLPGPQGLTGDTGAQGPAGPQGAQGARGERGERGEKGEKGDTGAQGAAGPSDIYTTTGAGATLSGAFTEHATLSLPAGSYLLIGQANGLASSAIGEILIRCRLRHNVTDVTSQDISHHEDGGADNDASTNPHLSNLLLISPLVTSGGTVTLGCRGVFGLPLVGDVQLTAIKTGALHT